MKTNPQDNLDDKIWEILKTLEPKTTPIVDVEIDWQPVIEPLAQLLAQPSVVLPEKVDRFEVIDNEGRAYAKGSIYGSPVSVELSYQDEGRTLKVFVKALNNKKGS